MVSVETSKSRLQITGDEEAVAVGRLAQAERTRRSLFRGDWRSLCRRCAELNCVRHELSFAGLLGVNHDSIADTQVRQLGGGFILAERGFGHDGNGNQLVRGGPDGDGVFGHAGHGADHMLFVAMSKSSRGYERYAGNQNQ